MADKQVKVAKPEKTKPQPVTPLPTKPITVKPAKASDGQCCTRCSCPITETTGLVRAICSACDLALQEMHWQIEYVLLRRVTYMPETGNDEFSPGPKRLVELGYELRKPPNPKRRSFFQRKPSEAMTL